jgi:hypothetical protein
MEEVTELKTAMIKHKLAQNSITKNAIIDEACDVANFAAAIAEKMQEE